GQFGYELVQRRGLSRFKAATYVWFAGMIVPWAKHARTSIDLHRHAFDTAIRTGDLTFANYASQALNTSRLFTGGSLLEAQHEAERSLAFAQKTHFTGDVDIVVPQLALIRTLRGLTSKFGALDCDPFDELGFERHLADNPTLSIHACMYWVR